LTARNYYSEGQYEVMSPSGKKFRPTIGTYWRVKKSKFDQLDKDGRVWWGEDGSNMPRLKRFVSEVKAGVVPQTLWFHKDVGHTQDAKKQLIEAVKYENTENVLNSVKPTKLIRRMLQIATIPDAEDIILDFFVGSNTTTQAVIEQNQDDAGNRKVIAVQFPERLPIPESQRATLADVALERAKWALKAANGNSAEGGLRAFRMSVTNMRSWTGVAEKEVDTLATQIEAFADSLVPGWKPENVIWEVALREGFSLTSRIEKIPNTGKQNFHRVTDPDREQSFVICLDDALTLEAVRALKLPKNALFVCRDTALDDTLSANLALQCRLKVL
jgi:adenine-specific DNA-methyltransferase